MRAFIPRVRQQASEVREGMDLADVRRLCLFFAQSFPTLAIGNPSWSLSLFRSVPLRVAARLFFGVGCTARPHHKARLRLFSFLWYSVGVCFFPWSGPAFTRLRQDTYRVRRQQHYLLHAISERSYPAARMVSFLPHAPSCSIATFVRDH